MKQIQTNKFIQPVDLDIEQKDIHDKALEVYNLIAGMEGFTRERVKNIVVLSTEEVETLASVRMPYSPSHYIQKNQQMRALIYILTETGVTLLEALRLSWTDIFHNPRSLRFELLGESRTVPISEMVYTRLLQLPRLAQNVFSLLADEVTVNEDLNQRAILAGISREIYCYQIRHTFIVYQLSMGLSPYHVAKLMGFKDTAATPFIADTDYHRELFVHMDQWPIFWQFCIIERKFKESKNKSNEMSYKSRYRLLGNFLAGRPLNRTTFGEYMTHLSETHHSNFYLNQFVRTVKTLGLFYKSNEFVDFTYFKKPKKVAYDTLTAEDIRALAAVEIPYSRLKDISNTRDRAIIFLLATTGCRINEALYLTWDCLYSEPKAVMFKETKNGSDRLVPIADMVYDMLFTLPRKSKYIFPGIQDDTKYDATTFQLSIKRRAELAGINKRIFPHLFRHSFITEMIKQGVSIIHIGRIVGHSDVQTTAGYTNLVIDDLREVLYNHPLLKQSITFEQLTKKMRSVLTQSVDKSNFDTEIRESNNEVTIIIRKAEVK